MKRNNLLTATILSMSLLTVMAGAAVAPALGAVKQHFVTANPLLIQFIVSMPALFIILTTFLFPLLCRCLRTRTIAVAGLMLYVVAGTGAFFADNIGLLLALRALLGVSVGLIMPLSTGLIAYYFPPESMPRLMGLSAAMNQMGGVIATLLAGILASVRWNYAFLVYAMGLFALILVLLFLPNEQLHSGRQVALRDKIRTLLHFHPSVVGMLLLMIIFFIYPTNFALTGMQFGLSSIAITYIMVGLDVIAFAVGLLFGRLMGRFRISMKYMAPIGFMIGYGVLAYSSSITALLIGSAFIGIANGVGVPYLNTIASVKGGQDAITTVMPLLSAALYLGQFVSPVLVNPMAQLLFADDVQGVYKIGVALCVVFLLQVFGTRHFQMLPPRDKQR